MISEASHSLTPETPSLTVRAAELVKDLRALAYDHVELVALEAQRAAGSLATMLCAAVVISILCVTAWLALVAGAIVWATASGVSWASALAIAAITNVIASGLLALWLRRQAGEIVFGATLRQLRGDAARAAGDGP